MRAIPADNLAYPALLVLDSGNTGSGFFINTDQASFLITAKHVLFDDNGVLHARSLVVTAYSRDLKDPQANKLRIDLEGLEVAGGIRRHSTHDAASVRIGNLASPTPPSELTLLPQVKKLAAAQTGIVGVPIQNIKRMDEVLVSNDVFVFGYPVSLGLSHLPQLETEKPLLRKGIVAGRNDSLRTLILDCPVYPGNSGGPVLEIEQEGLSFNYRLIGLVSQFVPFEEKWVNETLGYTNNSIGNSGYSVAVPMDVVLELL